MQRGSVLCGFGKTKFREAPKEESLIGDSDITFEVDAESFALADGKFGTIAEHLDANIQSGKPTAGKIAYHKTSKDPDGKWILEQDCPFHGCSKSTPCSYIIVLGCSCEVSTSLEGSKTDWLQPSKTCPPKGALRPVHHGQGG